MDKISKFLTKEDPVSKLTKLMDARSRLGPNSFSSLFDAINRFSSPLKWERNPLNQLDQILKIYHANPTHFPIMDSHLKGIKQSHLDIYSHWDKLSSLTQTDTLSRQIKSIERIMSGLTFQAADLVSKTDKWDLFEDFDKISNEAAQINDRISEKQSISKADLDDIRTLIRGVEVKVEQKDRDFFSILLKWLAIISFVMMLVQEKRYLNAKDEALTKEEFENFKNEVTNAIKETITTKEAILTIKRDCNLRLKPGARTLILGKLAKGDTVVVLQTSGKWVYVHLKDDMTTSGWAFKKYTERPAKN